MQRDGFVYAERTHVNIEEAEVEFTGVIASISGTAPALTLVIDGAPGRPDRGSPRIAPDQWLDQSQEIPIEGDAVGGLFEMEGTLAGSSGTCPTLAFSVSGYSITTTATTVFVPNCSALSNGTKVLVKGVVQAGGSVAATRVEKQ